MNFAQFKKFVADNIRQTKKEANKNSDSPGYGILLPHYSINTSGWTDEEYEKLDWYWQLIETRYNVTLAVSQYDDLVIFTCKYSGDYEC
jgi:hypothetical protein